MSIDPRLTILLTLKGRHLFTLRWLWHANRTHLPFRIFIADGEVHSTVARLIADRSVFPNLEIAYHRYDDRTFYDFYQKLDDALSKITTPYVMMVDNDDFLFPSGVTKSLQYLERSIDYVCAGGCVGHFEMQTGKTDSLNLTGNIQKLWYQQSKAYQSFDLNGSLASERAINVYDSSFTVHYNIYRLDALRCIASEQLKYNFSRLESAELFWKLRTATLGKLKSDPSLLSYLRQIGTSLNPLRKDDFVETLSAGVYIEEIRDVLKAVASIASSRDGISGDAIERQLNRISAEHLRSKLIQIFGWRAAVKLCFKKYLPDTLLQWLRRAGEWVRSGKSSATGGRPISRERLFRLLAETGAPEALVNEQKRELAEIEATLQGNEFFVFLQHQVPELLARS